MDISSRHASVAEIYEFSYSTYALVSATVALSLVYATRKLTNSTAQTKVDGNKPPHIPHKIPFLGNAVSFGESPIEFLIAAYNKYGPVFSFTMVGKTFTYLVGSEASALFFNSKNEDLNAEEVYGKLVTPVFGKGVAYDVPHPVFLEQKKILKTGLNIARFKQHIPMIEEETQQYFSSWGQSGEEDLFKALSELIILTASRCLHGKEIRSMLSAEVAQLYQDLDGGFSPEAWLLPTWVPLPSFRKRDAAHKKVKQLFYKAIKKRKESEEKEDDMLQTLLESTYKTGKHLSDDEIAGMMIGLLMAGQHTSSSSGSWLGLFLAKHKHVQDALYEEQLNIFGKDLPPVDYEGLKNCQYLDACLKESLRLRPPIMTMMRMCKTPLNIGEYVIPEGHQVCVSPTTNQSLPDVWQDFDQYNPERFLDKSNSATSDEKFSYVPFGAGRHRCIGEMFAYVQIKTIFSLLVRMFQFELVDGKFPEVNYASMIHVPKCSVVRYKRRT